MEEKTQTCSCEEETCKHNCDNVSECEQEKNAKKKKKEKKDEMQELKARIQELEEKNSLLEEAVLREKAESINYRKRKDEEVAKKFKYANEDLVKEILPNLDNFERAIMMDDDNLEDEVSKFLAGFKMVYCNMVEVLGKYGVKAIDGNKKPFDGIYHQAVLTEHVDGVEPGMVLEVLQKGYLLEDKVIRPAMVKVSE